MCLSIGERIAKWAIFFISLFGMGLPFLWNAIGEQTVPNDLFSFVYILSAFAFFLLLIGWFLVCFEKKSGKQLLILCSISMIIPYALAALYFAVAAPSVFTALLLLPLLMSVAVFWLQHIWTKYIF